MEVLQYVLPPVWVILIGVVVGSVRKAFTFVWALRGSKATQRAEILRALADYEAGGSKRPTVRALRQRRDGGT
jgi:hypothetical protein